MALDLVEILLHLLDGHEWIEQMALLDIPTWGEVVVVIEGLDMVVWVGSEEVPVHLRVGRRLGRPLTPELVGHWVSHKFVLWASKDLVGDRSWWLRIRVILRVIFLCRKETEMFTPESPAQHGSVLACLVGFAVHGSVDQVCVLHHNCKLAVVQT